MEIQKRQRSLNFSQEELGLLVNLAEKKQQVIENKKSDSITWQEKEKAWKKIETEFNSSSSTVFRSAKTLKTKYEGIKRDTRKKSALIRAELYKTGGGTSVAPTLTNVEQKVKDMILLSVEGNVSSCDSDFIIPSSSKSQNNDDPDPAPTINIVHKRGEHEVLETLETEDTGEPSAKKICDGIGDNLSKTLQTDNINEGPGPQSPVNSSEWKSWNPTALKKKKHPALNKPKDKRAFDILTDVRIEAANIQKMIAEEDLIIKRLLKELIQKELIFKDRVYELELQKLELQIEQLKNKKN